MEQWKKVCFYVSIYAIFREFRPIDPFVIHYLSSLSENYTVLKIREMYPIASYCSVFFVVIIFLVTDYLRYKPIMILNGFAGIMAYALLLGNPSMTTLKISQVFKTLFRAADVAYYTYMFANITNKSQYQVATSRVNTSVLIGKFSCGLLAQIFISFRPECSSYTYLLSLSIIGMILTTIWSFAMPPASFSLYFYKKKELVINVIDDNKGNLVQSKSLERILESQDKAILKTKFIKMKCPEVIQKLWTDFKIAYSDINVLKWSVWWSLSLCGYVLVANYIQLQWQEIIAHEKNTLLLNGAVDSLGTLFSAAASYAVGKVDGGWDKYSELMLALVALGQGVMLSFLAETESLTSSYICYIVFCCSYQTMLTLSSSEVAKYLKRDCYGLVFGFNKFISSILITIFTVVIVEDTFFTLDIRKQYFIYGMYFVFMGCLFITLMGFTTVRKYRKTIIIQNKIDLIS